MNVLNKFEKLRKQRAIIEDGPHPRASVGIAERLATELEQWARQADAGEVLDRVCMRWSGWTRTGQTLGRPVWVRGNNKRASVKAYSTDPAAAMELLEAMEGFLEFWPRIRAGKQSGETQDHYATVRADTPQLAIARACAVLAARGIARGEQ